MCCLDIICSLIFEKARGTYGGTTPYFSQNSSNTHAEKGPDCPQEQSWELATEVEHFELPESVGKHYRGTN